MNSEWYQANPMPYLHQQDNGQLEMMREPKHGHGGGKPGHHGGYGNPSHGPHGGFQGGLPFLGGLAGGLLAGSLINSPGAYPYNPYYGYYPGYPQAGYPPYQGYPYPPYGGYYY
jgi:hypothetical protein